MRLPLDRALFCLQLLLEGNSIRSTERITKVHRDTILSLLEVAGLCAEPWVQPKKINDALESPKGYIVSGCWELKRKFRLT
jgi:hypothetical protein